MCVFVCVTPVWTCCWKNQLPKIWSPVDNDMALLAVCVCTWGTGGFQRMFLSGAGVNPVVPVGLFFRRRTTPLGSSLSLTTRFFSCQPTWRPAGGHRELRSHHGWWPKCRILIGRIYTSSSKSSKICVVSWPHIFYSGLKSSRKFRFKSRFKVSEKIHF